jgi:plastocyanin
MVNIRVALGAAFLAAAAAGCGGSSTSSSSPAASSAPSASSASAGSAGVNLGTATETVKATDQLKFDPGTTTAHVGDIVQWSNTGSVTHTVTFDSNQSLSDAALAAGGTWEVKFNAAGTYAYHCTIHANMSGTITVS